MSASDKTKEPIELEEFDGTVPLAVIMEEFSKVGYSKEFLKDLEEGLASSSAYADRTENEVLWQ